MSKWELENYGAGSPALIVALLDGFEPFFVTQAEGRGRPTVWLKKEVAARPVEVYVVEWGSELPAEVDSIWATLAEAQKRAEELNGKTGGWRVAAWKLRTEWEPEGTM